MNPRLVMVLNVRYSVLDLIFKVKLEQVNI
jgi:hypothetical protein